MLWLENFMGNEMSSFRQKIGFLVGGGEAEVTLLIEIKEWFNIMVIEIKAVIDTLGTISVIHQELLNCQNSICL